MTKGGDAVLRQYELMTIHRPELTEGQYREKVSELSEFLAGQGAVNQETDPWGKRRLAYKIDHVSEGYYTVNRFESEPATVDALRRVLSLADEVLRHKVVRPES
ncbi:MAG: 30S ribosomal protein S6 [bacterium]|nr:30S ribosomal protein S6 [bacterium]